MHYPGKLWFAFLMCLVMTGVAAAAFAVFHPPFSELNSDVAMAVQIGGWATGPVMGLLSLILIMILNLIRRIVRMRKIAWLHPVVVLIGTVPWLILSWMLLDEPRYTELAAVILDFIARPMLWGSLVATLLTILLSIPVFISTKK